MSYNISEIQKAAEKSGMQEFELLSLLSNLPKKRSSIENRSIHKLFFHISTELTNLGLEFEYIGLKGVNLSIPWTPNLVKEMLWKPLQNALLEKSSTTKLTNSDIKMIFGILERWFAKSYGIELFFPSKTEEYSNYINNIKHE